METAPPNRVTLRVIAEKAKVSRMTVSRALRNDRSIPKSTCRRIQAVAHQLGYRPDPNLARLLATIRVGKREQIPQVIAYLTAYDHPTEWRNHPVRRRFFEAATQRASECGYRLEEFSAKQAGMTDERLTQIVHHRGIEGVIVAPLPSPQPAFQRLNWDHFSAVEIGYSLTSPELHRVCNHQFQSVMLLARKLHEFGYRRVGLAMNLEQDERVNHHWLAGHLAAQSVWGPGSEPGLTFLPPAWDRAAFTHWLKRQCPDSIITVGRHVETWLAELGLRVPRDIGLANVDLPPDRTGVTGINQNAPVVGAAAVDLVISLMRQNERGIPKIPRVMMVQGKFVAGKTTRRHVRLRSGTRAAPAPDLF